MTTEEEMKRMEQEMEARQQEAMINPDALADGKDTVGADVGSGSENDIGNGDTGTGSDTGSDTGGVDEQQNDPNMASQIEDKKSQIEAAGGVVNITSSSYFKGKAKQFELLKSLDKQLDKALQAKSPEELATNLFWAVLSAPFDTLNAYMDHRKAEKERLQKEYDEKTAAHDRELGVKTKDKFITGWWETIKNLPPEYQKYMDEEGRLDLKKMPKKELKNLKKMVLSNPKIRGAVETKCERQIEDKEWNKIVDGMFSFYSEKTPEMPKEKPKEPTISDLLKENMKTNQVLEQILATQNKLLMRGQEEHQAAQTYQKEGETLAANRAALDQRLGKNGRVINGGRSFNQPHKNHDNGH